MRSATAAGLPFLQSVFLDSMKESISAARNGWDVGHETAQFQRQLVLETTRVIEQAGLSVGFVMTVHTDEDVQIHTLCIAPEFQDRGIGSHIVRLVIQEARELRVGVTLSALNVNTRARALYNRLKFVVINDSEHHYDMRLASEGGE